jgi:hypothetical protein
VLIAEDMSMSTFKEFSLLGRADVVQFKKVTATVEARTSTLEHRREALSAETRIRRVIT